MMRFVWMALGLALLLLGTLGAMQPNAMGAGLVALSGAVLMGVERICDVLENRSLP